MIQKFFFEPLKCQVKRVWQLSQRICQFKENQTYSEQNSGTVNLQTNNLSIHSLQLSKQKTNPYFQQHK